MMPSPKKLKSNTFTKNYYKLCSRLGCMPLSHVKVHIPSQSLEVICDNIEADEWKPILKAISSERNLRIISITHKNLFHVTYFKGTNLQSNVHRIQQGPVNSTSSNIVTLTKALLMHIQFSRTLSCLQLQGIRLKEAAVDNLCKGLETNDSLQKLVLKECPLTNIGCQKICEAIQNCRTIKSLELQNCNITHCGALSLAEAIKSQEVYREEIWVKNSVDRTSGKNHAMGIERINLSGNQTLGDKGLQYILLALFGNDGVKAVVMNNCGFSSYYCAVILELVKMNDNIIEFELQGNPGMDNNFLENVKTAVRKNCTRSSRNPHIKQMKASDKYSAMNSFIGFCMPNDYGAAIDAKTGQSKQRRESRKLFDNPFAKISEKGVNEFIESMRLKATIGRPMSEKSKSAYGKILDDLLQELIDSMSKFPSSAVEPTDLAMWQILGHTQEGMKKKNIMERRYVL